MCGISSPGGPGVSTKSAAVWAGALEPHMVSWARGPPSADPQPLHSVMTMKQFANLFVPNNVFFSPLCLDWFKLKVFRGFSKILHFSLTWNVFHWGMFLLRIVDASKPRSVPP